MQGSRYGLDPDERSILVTSVHHGAGSDDSLPLESARCLGFERMTDVCTLPEPPLAAPPPYPWLWRAISEDVRSKEFRVALDVRLSMMTSATPMSVTIMAYSTSACPRSLNLDRLMGDFKVRSYLR
jgi:hypothetical protein